MSGKGFESLEVYRLAEELADRIWELVTGWDEFARHTVGRQMVRAADSIGANIAEGCGRGSFRENRHFARLGRGSLNETRHFLRRAFRRGLPTEDQIGQLQPLITELAPRLNAYIRSLSRTTAPSPQVTNNQ